MRRLAAAVLAVVLAFGPVSCGSEETPAEAAPALVDRLDAVDGAVEDGDAAALRRALDALVAEATRARDSGDLTDAQATRILDAAADLADALPGAFPRTSRTSSPSATPETSSPPPPAPTEDVEEPPAPETDEDEGEGEEEEKGESGEGDRDEDKDDGGSKGGSKGKGKGKKDG